MEICEVCKKPLNECVCCPECGHICDLDKGEYYCPVCFPKKAIREDIKEEDVH